MSIARITATPAGEAAFLSEIEHSWKERTYRFQAVRRTCLPKAKGKVRPLGIPTVRERVIQAAGLLIVEPIFEVDLEGCPPGFGLEGRHTMRCGP